MCPREEDKPRAGASGSALGTYELLEPIGSGSFGQVWRALQRATGQTVAIKVLRFPEDASPSQRERRAARFIREMEVCGRLHHPHIVSLLDAGRTEGGELFAAFEFVPGLSLRDHLLRHGPFPAPVAAELMGQVLEALSCAHREGIVHRDLKPENIMIMTSGPRPLVRVLDFGISMVMDEFLAARRARITLTNEAIGTPAYAAPEQLRGEPATPRSDLYAWGLVFVEALTGQPVMRGKSVAEVLHAQLSHAEVQLPRGLLGHPLGRLLGRVLKKDQSARAADADDIWATLSRLHVADLVGRLAARDAEPDERGAYAVTRDGSSAITVTERRPVTVMSISLMVAFSRSDELDFEGVDELVSDQFELCAELGQRYGAHVTPVVADRTLLFFGHPQAQEDDPLRAVQAALELADQVRRRSALLEARHGVRLELRIGMHTGMVLTRGVNLRSGITASVAARLETQTASGTILVSEDVRRLVERRCELEPADGLSLGELGPRLPAFRLLGERPEESLAFAGGDGPGPFVGRADELAFLQQRLEEAQAERGSCVLLCGEAGIGKSRLVREFRRSPKLSGVRWRECRASPESRNSALAPLLALLRHEAGLTVPLPPTAARRRLQDFLHDHGLTDPDLTALLSIWLGLPIDRGAVLSQSPAMQRAKLLNALVELLTRGRGATSVLVFEDVHWADPTTLELIVALQTRIPDRALLVLLLARPELALELEGAHVYKRVLPSLEQRETEALVAKLTRDRPPPPGLVQRIVERSDGLPLFVEEVSRSLLEADPSSDASGVPETLRASLMARLDRLGRAKETAQVAAILGREFEYDLLARVSLRDEGALQDDLDNLTAAGILAKRRHVHGASYVFRHALIRDAAHASLARPIRQSRHALVASVVEESFPEQAEERPEWLATHWAEAGNFSRAVFHAQRAASQALLRSANPEALEIAQRALEWLGADTALAERGAAELELRATMIPALMATRGWTDPELHACVDHGLALAVSMPDAPHSLQVRWGAMLYYSASGINHDKARGLASDLASVAERTGDGALLVASLAQQGHALWTQGDYRAALAVVLRAAGAYDRVAHRSSAYAFGHDGLVAAHAHLANISWFVGLRAAAQQRAERAVSHAREVGHPGSIAYALLFASLHAQLEGERDRVKVMTEEALSISDRYGLPLHAAYSGAIRAWAISDPAYGRAHLDFLERAGAMVGTSYYRACVAQAAWDAGERAEADAQLARAFAFAQNYESWFTAKLLMLRARWSAARGEPAHPDLYNALALANTQGAHGVALDAAIALSKTRASGDDSARVLAALTSTLGLLDTDLQEEPLAWRARELAGQISASLGITTLKEPAS